MELRVYRTFRWVVAVPMSEIRIGGRNPMTLQATDELQYRNADGAWRPVDVVQGPKPEHPQDQREREQAQRVSDAMDDALANLKCYHCRAPVKVGEPHECAEKK